MKKIIDLKETIAKKKEQEAVPVKKEEFYAKIDDPKDLIPLLFDSDTTEVYELVSLISYTLAVRTAERFKEMMMGVDELSIRIILSTIEVMPSRESVRLLRTLFLFDEIHLTFDSQGWRNAPDNLLEYISLQRHLHKCIFGASQVWTRVNKVIKEQTDYVIECKSYFNARLIVNKCYTNENYQINGTQKDSGVVSKPYKS